jgi:hypothetical protein
MHISLTICYTKDTSLQPPLNWTLTHLKPKPELFPAFQGLASQLWQGAGYPP